MVFFHLYTPRTQTLLFCVSLLPQCTNLPQQCFVLFFLMLIFFFRLCGLLQCGEREILSFMKQTEVCRPWPALLCHSVTRRQSTIIFFFFFLIRLPQQISANSFSKNNHIMVPSVGTVTLSFNLLVSVWCHTEAFD